MIILIALAATCKAISDKLQFHFTTSIFQDLGEFWNPKESWKRKWKNGDKTQGEAFRFSSTWLVAFTDAWHLFQSLQWHFIIIAIVLNYSLTPYQILDFMILRFGIYVPFFHYPFTYFLNRSKEKMI